MYCGDNMKKKKLVIVTGTRAEWGLLSPLARRLADTQGVDLGIIATNMHLSERYGHTIDEICSAGFTVDACVPMDANGDDSEVARVDSMARCMEGMARAFSRLSPDGIIILGDRYEMLAVASTALMMRIPIIHIAGGEISEGAVDDSIRHAITKMASLHLTATEDFRRRVIQMGEDPSRVVNTGAIGVYNIMNEPLMDVDELSRSIGMDLRRPTVLLTYHPVTLDPVAPDRRMAEVIEALDRFDDVNVLITYPNNDARGSLIISMIERWARSQPDRVHAVPSLGMKRYLSALRCVRAVVGNSSSGLVEVPSMKIPTVNIGMRQQGRLAPSSVISCGDSADEIAAAVGRALSPEGQRGARECQNPYYQPDTLDKMVRAILECELSPIKHFHDL